ncbi:MAG: YiiX/YebB-like N1pC/P60 family cysteine hydrolase [Mariprofundaceae bacterium]
MAIRFPALIIAAMLLLSLPIQAEPFSWQRDALFSELEQQFNEARRLPPEEREGLFHALEQEGKRHLAAIRNSGNRVPLTVLADLESMQFRLAAIAAAHHALLQPLQDFIAKAHRQVISSSRSWKESGDELRDAIYRVLYGGRSAVEEAWLQNQATALPGILTLHDAPSLTPSALVEGVRIHSGDIVLSRAGAPTSALIARGSDYPGNFSHAALVHVDPVTHKPVVIEALIEHGLVVTSLGQYLEDKKQRILLLRPRPDHPALLKDPLLPHRAAETMLAKARNHIGYDFEMDWREDGKYFCSEVPYHAYLAHGIELWRFRTTMSSPGVRRWLGDMGVTHFTTLAPSDLEYDSQLVSVVEWRDSKVLKDDRVDNAIMDALLEKANHGLRLVYPAYKLPLAGVVKMWSWMQPILGLEPNIPKGMSLGAALRIRALVDDVYPVLRTELKSKARGFLLANGYEPPYWTLLKLAQETIEQQQPSLSRNVYLQEAHP